MCAVDHTKRNQEAPMYAAKNLMRLVCEQNSPRLSLLKLRKVKDEIKLTEFSWVLAFCESNYETLGAINQDTESLYIKFKGTADVYLKLLNEEALKLLPKSADEITPWYPSDTSQLSYKVAPRRLAKLCKSIKEFNHIINNKSSTQPGQKSTGEQVIHIRYSPIIQTNNFHADIPYIEAPTSLSESPTEYSDNDVNIVVVTIILPKLLPDKKKNLSKKDLNLLCENIFNQLTKVLNANGASVTNNLPKRNKKDGEIKGIEKNGEHIKLSYEALERRVKSRLLQAYYDNF